MANRPVSDDFDLKRVPIAVGCLGLLAFPMAFVQASSGVLQSSPMIVFLFVVFLLSAIGAVAYFTVFRNLPPKLRRSPYLICFAVFAFAAIMDLLIGLTLLGYTDVMRAYFETGEPYLNSNHGLAINLWDGTVHFALYLLMSFFLASAVNHYRIALFWVGSLIVSALVYMIGNLIGEYAEHIEPSYLLNVPFMILPIFYAWKVSQETHFERSTERSPRGLQVYLLTLGLLAVSALAAYRMLVVLNPEITATRMWGAEVEPYLLSPARYPQIQMMAYGLYIMPFAILSAIALWRPPSKGIALWSWIFAGAVAQGQFSHIFASIASSSDPQYAVAEGRQFLFWASNTLTMLIPLWFAWYYCSGLKLKKN